MAQISGLCSRCGAPARTDTLIPKERGDPKIRPLLLRACPQQEDQHDDGSHCTGNGVGRSACFTLPVPTLVSLPAHQFTLASLAASDHALRLRSDPAPSIVHSNRRSSFVGLHRDAQPCLSPGPAAFAEGCCMLVRPLGPIAPNKKSPTQLMRGRGLWLHIHGAHELRQASA